AGRTTRAAAAPAVVLGKVAGGSRSGRAFRSAGRLPRRVGGTRVWPLPAPAKIRSGPSRCSTASRCAGFSPAISSSRAARWSSGAAIDRQSIGPRPPLHRPSPGGHGGESAVGPEVMFGRAAASLPADVGMSAANLGAGTVYRLSRTGFGYVAAFSVFAGGLFAPLSQLRLVQEGHPTAWTNVWLVIAASTLAGLAVGYATARHRRQAAHVLMAV